MTDEAHQARIEAIARELGTAFDTPYHLLPVTTVAGLRKRAEAIIAADPGTVWMQTDEWQLAGIHSQLAAASAEIETLQQMVDSTNQTNAAMGKRLEEQEDLHTDVLEVLRKADAEIERLETDMRTITKLCGITADQLTEAKEALREIGFNHPLHPWDIAQKTLKRLEGNDG